MIECVRYNMVAVMEFKNVDDLNAYLDGRKMPQFEVIPVARMFEHPQTKQLVNSLTYVLVMGY